MMSSRALGRVFQGEWKFGGFLVPRLFWAFSHGYFAYGANLYLVGGAFVAGMIMSYVHIRTGSLLTAVLIHGFYNSSILILAAI